MSESTLEICQRERLLRLDAHIRFEFELTAQRMTYLAIAESFLFSTFVLALANSSSPNVHPLLIRVISMVPWFGMLLATIVLASVIGSISLTPKLLRERFILEVKSHKVLSILMWAIPVGKSFWDISLRFVSLQLFSEHGFLFGQVVQRSGLKLHKNYVSHFFWSWGTCKGLKSV